MGAGCGGRGCGNGGMPSEDRLPEAGRWRDSGRRTGLRIAATDPADCPARCDSAPGVQPRAAELG